MIFQILAGSQAACSSSGPSQSQELGIASWSPMGGRNLAQKPSPAASQVHQQCTASAEVAVGLDPRHSIGGCGSPRR